MGMTRRLSAFLVAAALFWAFRMAGRPARQDRPEIRVSTEMVQLYVAVTDSKGRYITGLKPGDFIVAEDGIRQKLAMFAEGDSAPKTISSFGEGQGKLSVAENPSSLGGDGSVDASKTPAATSDDDSLLSGASVFILFDTSNYMYRQFVFAQDAIADFVRALRGPDRIALYSYSRDLFRASVLTPDRMQVLRGVRMTVAGDDAALYDAMILTLRDSAQIEGRRVIVVFSNGPDNASLAPPEDVEELAQSEGVAIYMISTRQAQQDPVSTKVFKRISSSTGGEAFFAKNWREEKGAFAAVRDDLAHLYAVYYYPQPNPNRGWRAITVQLKNPEIRNRRIRARSGYRPLPTRVTGSPAS